MFCINFNEGKEPFSTIRKALKHDKERGSCENVCAHESSARARVFIHRGQFFIKKAYGLHLTTPKKITRHVYKYALPFSNLE